jgi:riboflavin synthase
MFTGIVTERGVVRRTRESDGCLTLEIRAPETTRGMHRGDSVSVDGVCLTARKVSGRSFTADVMGETLTRTTLGTLDRGANVNLELPTRVFDRLGGHIVQGHVDAVGSVHRVADDGDGSRYISIQCDPGLLRYVVPKGSITVDGVSLTVVDVDKDSFRVALIPHTLEVTSLGQANEGTRLNIEVDVLAKYVERLIERTR